MSLDTLNTRLKYYGGDQLGRINQQKYNSFQSALKSSYQSRTIRVPNTGTIWQALINNDNLKPDYDNKILSVAAESMLEAGDVFQVIDDGSYWMIYLPQLTETAYLRTEIRRCRYTVDVNGTSYHIYLQGPVETRISWNLKDSTSWNSMNYSLEIFIKNTPETLKFFGRFTRIKIGGHAWEVQVCDSLSIPGIIQLEMKEYSDSLTDELPEIVKENTSAEIMGETKVKPGEEIGYQVDSSAINSLYSWSVTGNDKVSVTTLDAYPNIAKVKIADSASGTFTLTYGNKSLIVTIDSVASNITGPQTVNVYSKNSYAYNLSDTGVWSIDSTKAKILSQDNKNCVIQITSGKKGSFNLIYTTSTNSIIKYPIVIQSL